MRSRGVLLSALVLALHLAASECAAGARRWTAIERNDLEEQGRTEHAEESERVRPIWKGPCFKALALLTIGLLIAALVFMQAMGRSDVPSPEKPPIGHFALRTWKEGMENLTNIVADAYRHLQDTTTLATTASAAVHEYVPPGDSQEDLLRLVTGKGFARWLSLQNLSVKRQLLAKYKMVLFLCQSADEGEVFLKITKGIEKEHEVLSSLKGRFVPHLYHSFALGNWQAMAIENVQGPSLLEISRAFRHVAMVKMKNDYAEHFSQVIAEYRAENREMDLPTFEEYTLGTKSVCSPVYLQEYQKRFIGMVGKERMSRWFTDLIQYVEALHIEHGVEHRRLSIGDARLDGEGAVRFVGFETSAGGELFVPVDPGTPSSDLTYKAMKSWLAQLLTGGEADTVQCEDLPATTHATELQSPYINTLTSIVWGWGGSLEMTQPSK